MTDRVPTKVLPNGAIRYGVYDEAGKLQRYEYIRPEDEPTQTGMALNKGNLLSDETAALLGLPNTAVPDQALAALAKAAVVKEQYVDIPFILDGVDMTVEWQYAEQADGNGVSVVVLKNWSVNASEGRHAYWTEDFRKFTRIKPAVGLFYPDTVAYNNGVFLVITGGVAQAECYTSTDGKEWVPRGHPALFGQTGNVISALGKFWTISHIDYRFKILSSIDGASWSTAFSTDYIEGSFGFGIAYANGVGFSCNLMTGGPFYFSTDGITWSNSGSSGIQGTYPTTPFLSFKGRFIYVWGRDFYSSSDGITYTKTSYPDAIGGLAASDGLLVGYNRKTGKVYTSTDGISLTVTQKQTLEDTGYKLMLYGAGRFISIPSKTGDSVYSLNGEEWKNTARERLDFLTSILGKTLSIQNSQISGGLQVEIGSYVGTNRFGVSNPNILAFSFNPKLLLVQDGSGAAGGGASLICIKDVPTTSVFPCGTVYYTNYIKWEPRRVSWYSKDGSDRQMNYTNVLYRYFAIG